MPEATRVAECLKPRPTTPDARASAQKAGGGRGIRTPGTVSRTVVFKTTAIDHSAIPPFITLRALPSDSRLALSLDSPPLKSAKASLGSFPRTPRLRRTRRSASREGGREARLGREARALALYSTSSSDSLLVQHDYCHFSLRLPVGGCGSDNRLRACLRRHVTAPYRLP